MAKELLKYQFDEGFPSNTRVQQMPVLQQRTQFHNLIGKDSWYLLKLLQSNTGTSFLTANPKLWSQKSDYLKVKAIIKAIPVFNDASERALGPLTEFHDKLTHNSTAKHF